MTITVRQARRADAELVAALNADVQTVHAVALPERFKQPDSGSLLRMEISELLEKLDSLVFLAYFDQQPAGYAYAEVIRRAETSLTHACEVVHVHHISVLTRYRRRGVGTALLEAVRSSGRDLGITLLTLDVWSFNEAARNFFPRHGFDRYVERLWLSFGLQYLRAD